MTNNYSTDKLIRTMLPLAIFLMYGGFSGAVNKTNGNIKRDTVKKGSSPWYNRSYIHAHASLSFPVADSGYVGQEIDRVKPDVIEFHLDAPLWEMLNATKFYDKHGFKLAATINHAGTWINALYDNSDKYAYRVNADGSFAGRWDKKHLCLNSPGVDEVIIPEFYYQIPKKLRPAQVWIDESVITVNICYCKYCTALYKAQYHADPPLKLTAANWAEWEQWVSFHRKTYERWMEKVYLAVKKAGPNILVTFNHAYFVEQPEPPPYFINNLSADIYKDPLELGIYARYGGSGKLPFDLMPGLGADIWAGVKPKTVQDIYNEISLIIAHGGKWNIGEFPTTAHSVRKEDVAKGITARDADQYVALAEKGATYARERQPYCQNTRSVKYAALLHSATTHYAQVIVNTNTINNDGKLGITSDGAISHNALGRINSRIYWPNNLPFAEDMIGAYEALVEHHTQFDIINEGQLQQDLRSYKLLILPEQSHLQPKTLTMIRDFVKQGGRVIASGATIACGLEDLFGVRRLSLKTGDAADIRAPSGIFTVKTSWSVRNVKGKVWSTFNNSTDPIVITNTWGKGRTMYIAANIFDSYFDRSGYSFKPKDDERVIRDYMGELLNKMETSGTFNISANPWIETALRVNDTAVYLHLINRDSNWKQSKTPASDHVDADVTMNFRPKKVLLQPGGQSLSYQYDRGRLKLSFPESSIGMYQIIQIVK